MTGPYQRAIECLARISLVSPEYAGAFHLAIATFPAYTSTDIASDVMKQRQRNAMPSLADRCADFMERAQPGARFLNAEGRRSEIIGLDPEYEYVQYKNGYKPPEHGPWYRVMVYWNDAEPSEETMIWHTIGQPDQRDQRSPLTIDPALFVDLERHDKEPHG
jgi:hypothetical protein